jgi:carboxyl-terminal processing protease
MKVRFSWGDAKRVRSRALMAAGAVVIFGLGVLVGGGRLHFGSSGLKSQTGLPANLDYSTVDTVYNSLRENYDGKLTESQLLDGLKHGLATATKDPYTQYFTAKEAQDFTSQLQATFTGIGAELEQDDGGNIVVVAPLDGSPAAAAGLRAHDIIATINGTSTNGLTAQSAVTKIRGPKGTEVRLGIVRDKTTRLDLKITRGDIQIPTASSKILPGNIGYLQVSQFSDDTFNLVEKAVTSFQKAGVRKVILDLRDNPGGEVSAAQDIASLWLKQGSLIMQEKRGQDVIDSLKATGNNPFLGLPTVALVNGGSASAAEITAAALHDHKAATIMGEKSYGKGVVQQLVHFGDGSELKVTIASWYRPNGKNINHRGIMPDKAVKMTDADYKNGTDPQLQAAQDYLASQ